MVMGSLDMSFISTLCSKFNSGNCKLLPITNHFREVPFQLPQAFHGIYIVPQFILFDFSCLCVGTGDREFINTLH
jgi:hypothetical protein